MSYRSQFDTVAIDAQGNALSNVNASVFDAGTTNLVTIYSTRSGGGTLSNPITTPSTGLVQFWASPGSYDIKFEDNEFPARITTRTIGWEAVSGEDDGISWVQIDTGTGLTNADISSSAAIDASKLDTLHGRLKMTCGKVTSSGDMSPSTGWNYVPGMPISITPDVPAMAIVHGVFDCYYWQPQGAFETGGIGQIQGGLYVDYSLQPGTAISGCGVYHTIEADEVQVFTRNTAYQVWFVALSAASHDVGLVAAYSGDPGSSMIVKAGHTQMFYQLIAQ